MSTNIHVGTTPIVTWNHWLATDTRVWQKSTKTFCENQSATQNYNEECCIFYYFSLCATSFYVITIYNAYVCSYTFRVLFVPGELAVRCFPACRCIQPLAGSTVLTQRVAWRGQCPDDRGLRSGDGDSLRAVRAWTGWVTHTGGQRSQVLMTLPFTLYSQQPFYWKACGYSDRWEENEMLHEFLTCWL